MNPLAPIGDGRDAAGRFAKGNAGGPGNPDAKRVAALRQAFLAALTPDDVASVIAVLVDAAKRAEPWAVKELLDRALGKPTPPEDAPAIAVLHRHFIVPPPRLLTEPVGSDTSEDVG